MRVWKKEKTVFGKIDSLTTPNSTSFLYETGAIRVKREYADPYTVQVSFKLTNELTLQPWHVWCTVLLCVLCLSLFCVKVCVCVYGVYVCVSRYSPSPTLQLQWVIGGSCCQPSFHSLEFERPGESYRLCQWAIDRHQSVCCCCDASVRCRNVAPFSPSWRDMVRKCYCIVLILLFHLWSWVISFCFIGNWIQFIRFLSFHSFIYSDFIDSPFYILNFHTDATVVKSLFQRFTV